MPRSQEAPTTNAAIFNIKLSLPLMELETSSVMVPVSIGISPLLILSTMVNACSIASVMITMRAIRAESIKIEPRRYFFKTRCPRPGNIRPDRSAAFIDLLISSALAYGRLPERLLSAAISGHSDRSLHAYSECLLSGKRTFVNVNDAYLHELDQARSEVGAKRHPSASAVDPSNPYGPRTPWRTQALLGHAPSAQ